MTNQELKEHNRSVKEVERLDIPERTTCSQFSKAGNVKLQFLPITNEVRKARPTKSTFKGRYQTGKKSSLKATLNGLATEPELISAKNKIR